MRDLSKVLSEAELIKIRALLDQNPDLIGTHERGGEYPKMLVHDDYLELLLMKEGTQDPVIKKECTEKLRRCVLVVTNIEDEEEYLADGYKTTLAAVMTDAKCADGTLRYGLLDPRIPTGREGKRARVDAARSREAELQDLRRRYAELTGRRLADEPEALVASPSEDDVPPAKTPPATRALVPPHKRSAPARSGRVSAHP